MIGKVKKNEERIDAAYRSLQEKTGITKNDIILTSLLKCSTYKNNDIEWEFYGGKLNKYVELMIKQVGLLLNDKILEI